MDPAQERTGNRDRRALGILFAVPILGNVNSITTVLYVLWSVPAGTHVRPMGLACWIFVVAAGTATAGISLAILLPLILRWNRPALLLGALLCALLSCTPFFTGRLTYWHIVQRHHLVDVK